MAKIALLIGVSEYQAGFTPLPKASQDLEAMQRALQDHQTDGFDQIKVLRDPDLQTMRVEIEALFTGCSRGDLVLLFFSGHGIKDDQGRLYFATRDTRKAANGELRRATAMESGFVQEMMNNSRCKRQVIILDCCFSGAFAAGMGAKDSGTVDIAAQLGGEGRAVLTSSTSTQYSFEEQSADLSIYTRYIVEGLETGAADLNHDGWIEVEELHEYARSKVQETAPAMKPEIYAVKEGYKIRLTRARIGDPKLRYRQEADRYASRGEISAIGRILLDTLRERLGLSAEEAAQIEADLLRPYREHLDNLRRYREAVMAAAEVEYPFSEQTHSDLQHFQDVLGLRDEDVAPITAELAAQVAQKAEQHQQHLAEYQQALSETVEREFPLGEATRNELHQLQQTLQLSEAERASIEQPIFAQKEVEYQQRLEAERLRQQEEAERQQQAAIEQQRQQQEAKQRQQQQEAEQKQQGEAEQQKQHQEADYQQGLVFYEQEFIRLTRLGLSDVYVRGLRQLQQRLGLRDADVAEIQARVVAQQKIRQLQQRLGLRDTDIAEIEVRVTTQQKANGASQQQEIEKQRTNKFQILIWLSCICWLVAVGLIFVKLPFLLSFLFVAVGFVIFFWALEHFN